MHERVTLSGVVPPAGKMLSQIVEQLLTQKLTPACGVMWKVTGLGAIASQPIGASGRASRLASIT